MKQFNEHGYTMKAWEGPESEIVQVCAACLSPEAHQASYGDEGLTYCPDCQSIEQGYCYIHETEVDGLFVE